MFAQAQLDHTYAFSLYADHYQFYLGDSELDGDTGAPEFWSQEAFKRRLAVGHGIIGIGTELYGSVPVVLEVHDKAPSQDLGDWDHVAEASLLVPSGRIAIDGCLNFVPRALPYVTYRSPQIEVAPGIYRVRVYYGNLDSVRFEDADDGGEEVSDEHYTVVLWPAAYAEPATLRFKRAE